MNATDSSRSSELRFLSESGDPLSAPQEWDPAWIDLDELNLTKLEDGVTVRRNGRSLAVMRRRMGRTYRWVAEWPRSNPGHYEIVIEGIKSKGLLPRTVTVSPAKISPAQFEFLVSDLETRLPASVALGLQKGGALAGVSIREQSDLSLQQEIVRLRSILLGAPEGRRPTEPIEESPVASVGLVGVLKELARDPHELLRLEPLWVDAQRARFPQASALARALGVCGNLDGNSMPRRVLDRRAQRTSDTHENRVVRLLVHLADQRLRSCLRQLRHRGHSSEFINELENELLGPFERAVEAASFLSGVALKQDLVLELTMVMLRRDSYREALSLLLRLSRETPFMTVSIQEPELDAPLDNLPSLYQKWCTLQLLEVLLSVAAKLGFMIRRESLFRLERGGLFLRLLPDGEPLLELEHAGSGSLVRLTSERTVSRSGKTLRSVSFSQRPDLLMEVLLANGDRQLMIFDPKYKLDSNADGPKKEDIDKMHAYRDAICDQTGRRVVRHAGILFPGEGQSFGETVAAWGLRPGGDCGQVVALSEFLERRLGEAIEGTSGAA